MTGKLFALGVALAGSPSYQLPNSRACVPQKDVSIAINDTILRVNTVLH